MIEIIPGIKTTLARSLSQVRDSDIRETGDENALPAECKLPAVMIKDGATRITELAGGLVRLDISVVLILWVAVFKEDAALTGATNTTGILTLEDALWRVLDENKLGLDSVISAVKATPVPPSEPVTDGKRDMQRLKVTYRYTKQETRPSQA